MSALAAPDPSAAHWHAAAQALQRAALAVVHPGGPTLFDDLVQELAACLRVPAVMVAVFKDDTRTEMRTLATMLDGKALRSFDYPLAGSPCEKVVGREFRFVASGVAAEFHADTIFAAKGIDAYAAYPLNDSAGTPLGLLVAMDRVPMHDAALAESVLKVFAGRIAGEIERGRADRALRAAALAVSKARGDSVFAELVRYLATILGVEFAFIARHDSDQPDTLQTLAMFHDGELIEGVRYPICGTPCATVLGQQFRCYPSGLAQHFPHDHDLLIQGAQSYAGYPLSDLDGRPLGIVAVLSRQPLVHVERIESMLQIFAVRAAAEIERLRADEALRRSEASYRTIFDAAEDAIFVHDWHSGALVDVNPKACEIYGYTREELCRASVAELSSGVPPYTAEEAYAWIERAKRAPVCFEWHRRNKDGSLHWDEVRLKAVTIHGHSHVIAFTREITERKAAEEALRLREAQYRAIFDGSADALVLWNRDIRIVDINRAFTQMYGYTREDVVGQTFGDRLAVDSVQRRVSAIRRALAGEEVALEAETVKKSGAHFEVELRYLPIEHRGEPHVLAVARDITERKRAVEALQRSEARLRATIEAAFDAIVGMDGDGRVVEFNAAAERVFGHRRADVIGRHLASLIIPPRHRRAHGDGLQRFALTGQAPYLGRLVETTALRADGSEFPVEMAVSVATAPEGHIFVGHLRDISERRQAERQRADLEQQLRQAQKMEAIGQLTGGIAHDFNNILTSVLGYLTMAGERAEDHADARLAHQIGQATLAAQRARDLIAQMLAFARRQRGERHAMPLAPLMRQAVQLLRATLPASIELDAGDAQLHVDDAVAPVLADAVQLEQVLFNLCINARDAIEGAGRIQVRLREAECDDWTCAACRARVGAGRWVELSVRDSGGGIAPEVLERMFDPFFSTKEVGRGSGMGLAMVHGIVHDHGGHLHVQTHRGVGSLFCVRLPPAGTGARAAGGALAPARAVSAPLRGRVMVVEDQPMVGDFMTELLGDWGLEVVLHRDPVQAAAWLADVSRPLDLLLSDQTMPRLTGLELARRTHALRPALPIVIYTGHAGDLSPDELQLAGVRTVLHKPIAPADLRAALQPLLPQGRAAPAGDAADTPPA